MDFWEQVANEVAKEATSKIGELKRKLRTAYIVSAVLAALAAGVIIMEVVL